MVKGELEGELEHLARISKKDMVAELRRLGKDITPLGNNDFRGVKYKEMSGRWQARIKVELVGAQLPGGPYGGRSRDSRSCGNLWGALVHGASWSAGRQPCPLD